MLQYLVTLAIVAASLLLAKAVYWLFKNVAGRAAARTETKLDDAVIEKAEAPLIALLVTGGFYFAATRLDLDGAFAYVDGITFLLAAAMLTWLGLRLSGVLIEYWLKPMLQKTRGHMDDELLMFADKALKVAIILVAIIMVLSNFGYEVSALIAGLGIGGLAFALAAKDYLENIVGGFTIFTDRPFKLGDRVKLGDVDGFILDVGMRSTRMLTYDNTVVVVPNSQMITSKLVNYTARGRMLGVSMTLSLWAGTESGEIEKAKEIVRKAILAAEGVVKEREPLVYFKAIGDTGPKLWAKYWITDHEMELAVADRINTTIKRAFEKEGIELAFTPQAAPAKK